MNPRGKTPGRPGDAGAPDKDPMSAARDMPPTRVATTSKSVLDLGFDVVRSEDFGALPHPSLVALDGFVAAYLPSATRAPVDPSTGQTSDGRARDLVVSRAGPTLRVERTLKTLEPWLSFTRHVTTPVTVFSDMRLLRTDPEQQPLLLRQAVAIRPRFEAAIARSESVTVIMLTAPDWTRYFWGGLVGAMPFQTTVTDDPEGAWEAAGASAEERARLDHALGIALGDATSFRERVATALAQRPGLSLAEVARSLGVSVRKLQRCLADDGTSFARLRDAARWHVAERLVSAGDKTASVAQALGFASASHFIVWHKRIAGRTPRGTPARPARAERSDVGRPSDREGDDR